MSGNGETHAEPPGNGAQGAPNQDMVTHVPGTQMGSLYERSDDVSWRPDESSSKQVYILTWMQSTIQQGTYGADIRESFTDLVPPETLFAREVINGSSAPRMYKEMRDLIHARQGGIEKRRGLQIKKALALYYNDEQSRQDAADLAREIVEQGIQTLSTRRMDFARATPSPSEPDRSTSEDVLSTGVPAPQPTATVQTPRRFFGTAEFPNAATEETRHAPFRTRPSGPNRRPDGEREFVPLHRRNEHANHGVHRSQIPGPQGVSPHAVAVLSKLAQRFKDRADKFGGDDGENWEDIYSTYMNCVVQWGVPEHAALRNIENILAGQARTYYKRKFQPDPQYFKSCEEVNEFMLSTFHGREAQEATLEYLDSLSMYEQVREKGTLVLGLKAVRDAIVKHVNLVPHERQTDEDQIRWLKNAVRSYKWTRPTNARAHEMDFAKLYSTLRSQAIEEERSREAREKLERGRYRSRVGDRSLGKGIYYGDMYGNGKYNPRHKPYVPREKSQFRGSCYGCGERGYRRVDCPKCQKKNGFGDERKKALKSIHETTTLEEMSEVIDELCIQYGEDWAGALGEDPGQSGTGSDSSNDRDIQLAESTDEGEQSRSGVPDDEKLGAQDGYAAQFGIQFIHEPTAADTDPDTDPEVAEVNCTQPMALRQKVPLLTDHHITIPKKIPVLPIHAATQIQAHSFRGACLDTGASTSVCGLPQAKAYADFIGCRFLPKPSKKVFKFGATKERSLGTIDVRLPIPGDSYIQITVDIVRANIPLLIGLDALDEYQLYVNNIQNLLIHDRIGWSVPLQRLDGHMFYAWGNEILFTLPELRKMHKGFYHPSAEKLLNLIKRAEPKHATPKVRTLLKEISERCQVCQYHSPKPRRFTASINEGIVFNRTVILDLMWIHRRPLLHVVDKDTHYSAARFLPGESVDQVWQTFLLCWVATYNGYPDSVRSDAGSVFTSKSWNARTSQVGVAVQVVPVESSNSMGVGERYHDPLRRIYKKIEMEHPRHPKEIILALANKAMNDTMGPEGLVPSLLVFGVIPRVSAATSKLPEQAVRLSMMQTARDEMESITARLRLKTVLRSRLPKATHSILTEGDPVLVWRKKGKASNSSWTGPFQVIKIEGKVITVSDDRGMAREYNASAVKLYTVEDVQAETPEEGEPDNLDSNAFPDIESEPSESGSEPDDPGSDPDYYPEDDEREERAGEEFHGGCDLTDDEPIFLTEVLRPGDARGREARFEDARRKEVEGLEDMGTWEEVDERKVPRDANVMGSRFTLTIKHSGTAQELAKARLVVQGHTDREKFNVVHDSTTLHQRSIRIIVSLAGMFGFDVWAHDITQAYLQSESPLLRKVYLRPPAELHLPKGRLLRLIKPLYGLADSGDYWGTTNSRHHVQDLGMRPTCGDLSLYYRREREELSGLSGIIVDDTLQAGTQSFYDHTSKTVAMFKCKERQREDIIFAGVQVVKNHEGGFRLSQCDYARKLQTMDLGSTFQDLRSVRAKLAWLTNTRPDISCAVAKLAQVTEGTFTADSVKSANKIISHVRKAAELGIEVPPLDKDAASIIVLTDAALANNTDFSSQIGYVVAIRDANGNANLIEYSSRKCRRVTHSSLAGEIMAFSAGFDAGIILKHDLQSIMKQRIPLYMMTDSRGLFDMVTRNSYSAERRLMIDMAAIRQAYQCWDIDGIAHVSGASNPADAMTKIVQSGSLLDLMKGVMTVQATQWVMRSNTRGPDSPV